MKNSEKLKKLKPCPYCGSKSHRFSYWVNDAFGVLPMKSNEDMPIVAQRVSVQCKKCHHLGPPKLNEDRAINAYNSRAKLQIFTAFTDTEKQTAQSISNLIKRLINDGTNV